MILLNFLPILTFIFIYVGAGIYFSLLNIPNAFYQISATVAIIPAIALGWILNNGTTQEKMNRFINGIRHPDIIAMCIIFLLAGAFTSVTSSIGSVSSTINLALSLIPAKFLLIGIFITSAFISIAIGTSMGTIATIAPIAAGLAYQGVFSPVIAMATVVGGAMFGDNLSLISDTTIAAVMSQEADMKSKFKLNAIVAIIASIITIAILFSAHDANAVLEFKDYSILLILPYLLLIGLALAGINVFIVLFSSLVFAAFIGYIHHDYTLFEFNTDIVKGFASMHEIMLLSLMVGGLSGLANKNNKELTDKLALLISKAKGQKKLAQLMIGAIVSIFDILLANNTIAIIFSGDIARDIAKRHNIAPHYSAAWLDIFSCVFQGIIPYGAQMLLASSIARISPLSIMPHVYYCYILAIVTIGFILIKKSKPEIN